MIFDFGWLFRPAGWRNQCRHPLEVSTARGDNTQPGPAIARQFIRKNSAHPSSQTICAGLDRFSKIFSFIFAPTGLTVKAKGATWHPGISAPIGAWGHGMVIPRCISGESKQFLPEPRTPNGHKKKREGEIPSRCFENRLYPGFSSGMFLVADPWSCRLRCRPLRREHRPRQHRPRRCRSGDR